MARPRLGLLRPVLLACLFFGASTAPASAAVEHFSFFIEEPQTHPCTGEEILIEGEVRGVVATSTDGAGHIHQHVTQQHHQVTATVLSDPDVVYRIHQSITETFLLTESGSPQVVATSILTGDWHAPGSDTPDFWTRNRFHVTITPNGDVTAEKLSFESGCRPEPNSGP